MEADFQHWAIRSHFAELLGFEKLLRRDGSEFRIRDCLVAWERGMINRESASWESMSFDSRWCVARDAGFTNQFQLRRIAVSAWQLLTDQERTKIYRVDWSKTITRMERAGKRVGRIA